MCGSVRRKCVLVITSIIHFKTSFSRLQILRRKYCHYRRFGFFEGREQNEKNRRIVGLLGIFYATTNSLHLLFAQR